MKNMKWYWWVLIVIVILVVGYFIYKNQTENPESLLNRQRPKITSCPKGYVLHKGHCIAIPNEGGRLYV